MTDVSSAGLFFFLCFFSHFFPHCTLLFLIHSDFLVNILLSESSEVNDVEVKGVEFRSGTEDAGRCLSLEGRSPAVGVLIQHLRVRVRLFPSSHETYRAN